MVSREGNRMGRNSVSQDALPAFDDKCRRVSTYKVVQSIFF
jgi:hypothetical protein